MSRRRIARVLLVVSLGAAVSVPASADAYAPSPAQARAATAADDYSGIVALDNCSASVVRWPDSEPADNALVLSNGHCHELMGAREVVTDQPVSRDATLLAADGSDEVTLQTTSLVYATMYKTDVSLYRLDQTYQQLEDEYGVPALTVADEQTAPEQISVVSGYWKRTYTCASDGFVYKLHEADWDWTGSLRYGTPGCEVIGGTSGSPVLDPDTRSVVAVNNTINESGERCTMNNPCEEDENGTITVHQGVGYAEPTWWFTTCLDPQHRLDLSVAGCKLPKP